MAYSQTLTTTGGRTPIVWGGSVVGLPSGVTFSAGLLSGTTLQSGAFTFTVSATDAASRSASRSFTLNVGFAKLTPSNATRTASTTSATLTWSADNRAPATGGYRYCWSTSKTCTPSTVVNGTSVPISGLRANTTYYWQVQVLVSGSWVSANGGTYWRFTTAR